MGLPPEPREEDELPEFDVKWMENGVATLINHGHQLHQIREYTLPQFTIMLRAAERRDAEKRTQFITDISASIGALFGGGDSLTKHLAALQQFIEEKPDVSGKRT